MKPHLFGMLPEDLVAACAIDGAASPVGLSEARRVLAHVVTGGKDGFPSRLPISASAVESISGASRREKLEVVERATDPADGFVKYLFRLTDGLLIEAVRIPLEAPGRFTICLSSQAGCGMGCTFCATGRLGLSRNLEAWEIVAQFIQIRDEAPGVVTGAVFQGQGEPLHNFEHVMKTAAILSHPCGGRISSKRITVSTVGLVPAILKLAEAPPSFRLIVSLTSAIDEKRRSLLPAASAWNVDALADAMRRYQRAQGDRLTVAWVVLGGINTGNDEVESLRRLFRDIPIRINLIDVNDARENGFVRASEEELNSFRDRLRTLGVPVVRRYSGGAARHAACGMLASLTLGQAPAQP